MITSKLSDSMFLPIGFSIAIFLCAIGAFTLPAGAASLEAVALASSNSSPNSLTPPDIAIPNRPLVFDETFDEEVGLWIQPRAGHTRPVAKLASTRSGRIAANRLFVAAYLDALDPAQGTKILRALRQMQVIDGSTRHGCMRTYWEEKTPVDTNASFFIGLSLITLERTAAARLEPEGRALLESILADLAIWFAREAEDRTFYYPNKFMGDIVCAWLLQESVSPDGEAAFRLAGIMREAAVYWKDQHWGWGEHMSDSYAGLLVRQLSALLLLSRSLPDDLRNLYKGLFDELIAIEDQFAGGPRVPAIRSYAGAKIERPRSSRDAMKPLSQQNAQVIRELLAGDEKNATADIFSRLGWRRLAGPPAARRERIEIPCFDGHMARAWVTPAARLGTMSRYPIMPQTDRGGWGLSWQTMPVAFAAGSDGWGFLRWHARENQVDRYHPAAGHRSGYLDTLLSRSVLPPITGLTCSLQDGPDAIVVRRMPAIASTWELLSDQLVFTGGTFRVVKADGGGKVSRLLVKANDVPVTFFHVALDSSVSPVLETKGGQIVWQTVWDKSSLKSREQVMSVWIICWGREVEIPASLVEIKDPSIPSGVSWRIAWPRSGSPVEVAVSTRWKEEICILP